MKFMQKKFFKVLLLCTLVSGLAAWGIPTDEERSKELLGQAQAYFDKKEVNAAKLMIDSLHATYPKIVNVRRQADTLSWQIEQFEIQRNLPYVDSMLVVRMNEFEEQKPAFRFEKNDKYQDVGNFFVKSLQTENNIDRNYVRPYTDENGKFYVMSYFQGRKLRHNMLKASIGDLYAETGIVEVSDIHEYNDGGVCRETVLFTDEKLGTFPQFIAENAPEKIKITLIGDRENSYFMALDDKESFLKTFRLSSVLKELQELRFQQKKMLFRQEQIGRAHV